MFICISVVMFLVCLGLKEMVHFWLLWGAVGILPMQSTLIGLGTLRKDLEKLRPLSVTELLLSNDGDQILEGCLTNFFIVCRKDENEVTYKQKDADIKRSVEVQTAPSGDGVLPGVVRQVIIDICLRNGIPLREVAPSWSQCEMWVEAFITRLLFKFLCCIFLLCARLLNSTPVSYSEVHLTKKDNTLEGEDNLLREEGSKPECYTEEQEKLLGSTEMSWTLFVDGYGKDGKRIYDPVNGKTCHQCRQKTLGHRTHCSKCNMVQGQFCGDCLYMRYGEHVLEANQNPNWICPACRGICNCSLCRQAKGWPPTGTLYRKISSLGFKSVAHYLIQTRRLKSESETNSGIKVPVSAKRSLPFSSIEVTSMEKEPSRTDNNPPWSEFPQFDGKMTDNCFANEEKQDQRPEFLDNQQTLKLDSETNLELIVKPALTMNCITENSVLLVGIRKESEFLEDNKYECRNTPCEIGADTINRPLLDKASCDQKGASRTDPEIRENGDMLKDKEEDKIFCLGERHFGCFVAPESSPKSMKKHDCTTEPVADSIAARLRQMCHEDNEHDGTKNGIPDAKRELSNVSSPCKAEDTVNHSNSNSTTSDVTPLAGADSIAGRLKQRRDKCNEHEEQRSIGATKRTPDVKWESNNVSSPFNAEATLKHTTSNKKRVCISEASPDSIAGRLRQRRREAKAE